jgi:hypothetical protein
MPAHPASDKGTQRPDLKATGSGIIQGVPRNCAADALPFILPSHYRVQEDDGVVCQVIFRDPGQRAVEPRFVSAYQGIVIDSHAHDCQLCQIANISLRCSRIG